MNILSVLHFKSYYCCGQCKDLASTKGNTCPSDAMLSKWKAPGTLVLQRDVNTVLDSREWGAHSWTHSMLCRKQNQMERFSTNVLENSGNTQNL